MSITLDGDAITDKNTTVAIKVQIGEPVSFIVVTYGWMNMGEGLIPGAEMTQKTAA